MNVAFGVSAAILSEAHPGKTLVICHVCASIAAIALHASQRTAHGLARQAAKTRQARKDQG
ncbi:hypothetical protein KPSA3_00377 [Pseudomonas syringae pv. actinidiae]|uniref:Uncharacterized protein n=1 Tax=Pseudomonas syringae pv. actinidiae TaxID=103796 RepID=A0AAN4PZY3_PSESF|nr:hypothetical protein KPSA3_00377 [Pseudomonas syringae pv. actinidiae]